MGDSLKVERPQYSDYDLYAALMLSNLLDNEQDAKDKKLLQPVQQKTVIEEKEEENDEKLVDTNDVIWVPADKHPQIAPIEFANFIKTHGTKSPTKSGRLHRRRSILSQSLSVKSTKLEEEDEEDEADLNRTLSEKKRNFLKKVMADKDVFDRHSPILDESRIIAPKNDKSLLRRSAFSARGRTRKSAEDGLKRRSVSQRKSSSSDTNDTEKNQSWDKKSGIDLFDQPVNMSEWIDLGSLVQENDNSQRGILSRVHDAESQLRSNIQPQQQQQETPTIPRPVVKIKEPIVPPKVLVILKEQQEKQQPQSQPQPPKRPSIVRSPTETRTVVVKPEKRSSWLSGLFPSNNHKKSNNNNNTTSSSLSSLATLFSRSLSMKSNLPTLSTIHSTTPPSSSTHKSSIHTKTTTNTIIKSSSSPLSSPSPSPPLSKESKLSPSRLDEPILFNTNRLPLHVERAIYRLSHMKLADPKRPLQQQVLISNLMFWYLSIQQNDFQQQEKVQEPPQPIITSQPNNKKIGNKMSRLISSTKKRKKSNNNSSVQFNLYEEDDIPLSHYQS